jgi:hypothetical protein
VAHVDDLIEARAEPNLLARSFLLSRPHRVASDATRESRVGRRRKAKTLIPDRTLSRSGSRNACKNHYFNSPQNRSNVSPNRVVQGRPFLLMNVNQPS